MKKLGHIATKAAEGSYFVCYASWLTIWRDSISLDEDKLVVTRRGFLWKKIITVKLLDLFNVEILEAPIFCTVRVIGKYVTGGHEDVSFIRKREAYELYKKVTELTIDKTNPDQSGGQ